MRTKPFGPMRDYGEELISRTVSLPMIPNFTEEDVGNIIQAYR